MTKNGRILDKLFLERQIQNTLPWYQYLQIAHLINQSSRENSLRSDLTDFEKRINTGTIGHHGLIATL